MPFFEALVGRFYAGVADRPDPAPASTRRRTWPRPSPADPVPRPVLGRPADLRRRARPSAPPDAPRAVRDRRRPRATAGSSTCAPPSPSSRRRRTWPTRWSATSRWPPRRCATATDREHVGRVTSRYTAAGGRTASARAATWRRHRGGIGETRVTQAPSAERGKTVHGEAANAGPPRPRPRRRRGRGLSRDRAQRARPRPLARRPPGGADDRPGPGRRPRLRQPVRPADRPPRPRARRLLRAPARTTRRYAELERRGTRAIILSRRPEVGLRRRRAQARPGDLERPDPGPRHLLRRPAHGPRARRRRARRPASASTGRPTSRSPTRRRPVRRASTASSRSG